MERLHQLQLGQQLSSVAHGIEWTNTPADINGDGLTDLLWMYHGSLGLYVSTALNQGDGTFASATAATQLSSVAHGGWTNHPADINGDGLTDLLWMYHGS